MPLLIDALVSSLQDMLTSSSPVGAPVAVDLYWPAANPDRSILLPAATVPDGTPVKVTAPGAPGGVVSTLTIAVPCAAAFPAKVNVPIMTAMLLI
jgi:hypothetical protein